MILSITSKCSMGCSHCLGDYTPDGSHITDEMLAKCINFAKRIQTKIILVSGGEPTEHPRLIPILLQLQQELPGVVLSLISNGVFAEDMTYANDILELGIPIQVTNDDRYYPRKVPIIDHPNIMYTDRLICLYPQGRAENEQAVGIGSPKCFNIRSIACNQMVSSFSQVIRLMEQHQKYCQPFIDIDGTLHLGDSRLCPAVGSISDETESLFSSIRSYRCTACVLGRNLAPALRAHIEK